MRQDSKLIPDVDSSVEVMCVKLKMKVQGRRLVLDADSTAEDV